MENKQNQSGSSSFSSGRSGLNVQAEVDFLNYSDLLSQKSEKGCSFGSLAGCR